MTIMLLHPYYHAPNPLSLPQALKAIGKAFQSITATQRADLYLELCLHLSIVFRDQVKQNNLRGRYVLKFANPVLPSLCDWQAWCIRGGEMRVDLRQDPSLRLLTACIRLWNYMQQELPQVCHLGVMIISAPSDNNRSDHACATILCHSFSSSFQTPPSPVWLPGHSCCFDV